MLAIEKVIKLKMRPSIHKFFVKQWMSSMNRMVPSQDVHPPWLVRSLNADLPYTLCVIEPNRVYNIVYVTLETTVWNTICNTYGN